MSENPMETVPSEDSPATPTEPLENIIQKAVDEKPDILRNAEGVVPTDTDEKMVEVLEEQSRMKRASKEMKESMERHETLIADVVEAVEELTQSEIQMTPPDSGNLENPTPVADEGREDPETEPEEVIELNEDQISEAVAREVEKRVASLLKTMDERDEKMKAWSKNRDEQMGAHMNDIKRSVDAQNTRVAQWGHKIDALTANIMKKAAPETPPPPKEDPPEEAPPEAPAEEPKEEAPPEEEAPEPEPTTFIGQCTAGGDETHFFEKGEEHVKFCPEDGMRVKHYDKPKRLKTKPKVPKGSKPKPK